MSQNLLDKWESEVQDLSDNQVSLLKNYLELSEMSYVLTHIGNLLGDTELTSESLFGKLVSLKKSPYKYMNIRILLLFLH